LREAIHRTGLAFVDRGLLDRPEQLLHLSLTELKALAHGRSRNKLRELIREREREYREQNRLQPPPKLGSGDLPPPPAMAKTWEAPEDAGHSGNTIKGISGSRGRATGRARVFAETDQIPDVEEGDILVASNAGPDWTPIFPLLAGLVLDQGAVFQHAALIAREYKIPAVLMTKEATTTIKDGQTITVDGDAGVVELK
ncbi:MAG: pyruvate, water dikinase, partial [Planctomycetes bacterium]|nr:pyruvate, water dikinase [Planctomycetota bacterium]